MAGLVHQQINTFAVAWRCSRTVTSDQLTTWWQTFSAQQPLICLRLIADQPFPRVALATEPPPVPALISTSPNSTLASQLTEARERAWDLIRGPGARATILTNEDSHVLLIEAHPVMCDEPSFNHLVKNFLASTVDRAPTSSVDLRQVFMDYHSAASVAARTSLRETWRQYIRGAPAFIDLPCDFPRQSTRLGYAQIAHHLTSAAINGFNANQNCGTPVLLLVATAVVCARLTGQDDLVLGCLWSSDQPHPGGPCGGVWPARLDLRDDPTGSELVAQAHQATEHIARHRLLPVADIIETASSGGRQEYAPLFQVMVGEDPDFSAAAFSDLLLSDPIATSCDVAILVNPSGHLVLHYQPGLFAEATAKNLLSMVAFACDALVREPQIRLSAIRLQSPMDESALCTAHAHVCEFPSAPCLHEMVAVQASQRPTATALSADGKALTYGELNRRANQMARRLVALGVGPDVLVGHCLPRTVEAVIAILAILKAGGAYVPLDPAHPADRLAATIKDSGTRVVVSDLSLAGRFQDSHVTLVLVDHDADEIAALSDSAIPSQVQSHHLAYVIYTSGSTGLPKGVPITHAQVVRLFTATQAWFSFDANDVWTLFHSLAFDFSVWELWGPLLYGGRLVLIDELVRRSPADFHAVIRREKVTVLNQTPAAFYQFARADENAEQSTSLRLVIFGGEKLDLSALSRWFARHGDQQPRLVNMYGITETTVHVTYRPLTVDDLKRTNISPIGVPIPDLSLYLLDSALRPVPTGVIGEMYVGGAGVGRGYLNREELTASRFVPDPFRPGHRMYRSGDAARRLVDGEIDYVGRLDQQVKIRGYRIELGEIEAVLRGQSVVADCAVIAHQGSAQAADRVLVAYVVLRDAAATAERVIAELRTAVKDALPSHMVPAAFVLLERLPLTVNGKLDRRALPAPDSQVFASGALFIAATSTSERLVATAWSRVLGSERIGIDDNFFDIGGNSLRLVEVHATLERDLGRRLPIVDLFQFPTVRTLAQRIAPGGGGETANTHQATAERARRQQQAFAARRRNDRNTGP